MVLSTSETAITPSVNLQSFGFREPHVARPCQSAWSSLGTASNVGSVRVVTYATGVVPGSELSSRSPAFRAPEKKKKQKAAVQQVQQCGAQKIGTPSGGWLPHVVLRTNKEKHPKRTSLLRNTHAMAARRRHEPLPMRSQPSHAFNPPRMLQPSPPPQA